MCKFAGGMHGIVVVFAAFLTWVCAFGTTNSTGLYNLYFEKSFNVTSAAVSLVGAINMGVFYGAGPLVGILISRWSHRKIAVVGALLSSAGLHVAAMPFSPNIVYMYFFYGFLNGVGASMVVISSQVLCGEYFTKHRAFTSSIVLSGSGIGSTTFPIIINELSHMYGWTGSLLLLCGLNLHLIVFALLLFPVKFQVQHYKTADKGEDTKRPKNGVTTVSKERSNDVDSHIFSIDAADHITSTNTTNNSKETVHRKSWKKMEIITVCSRKLTNHFGKIRNTQFVIFLANRFLFNVGYNAVVNFLPKHSAAVGFNESNASLALTLLGAGLFFGCIIGGLFGSRQLRLAVVIVGSLGFGVTVILMNFFIQRFMYMTLSFFVGMFSGFESTHVYAVTFDILGKGAIETGFGYSMLLVGVGSMAGPPLAGSLVDMYKDTAWALHLSVAASVLSGLIMCPYLVQEILRSRRSVTTGQTVFAGSSVVTFVSAISEQM